MKKNCIFQWKHTFSPPFFFLLFSRQFPEHALAGSYISWAILGKPDTLPFDWEKQRNFLLTGQWNDAQVKWLDTCGQCKYKRATIENHATFL